MLVAAGTVIPIPRHMTHCRPSATELPGDAEANPSPRQGAERHPRLRGLPLSAQARGSGEGCLSPRRLENPRVVEAFDRRRGYGEPEVGA